MAKVTVDYVPIAALHAADYNPRSITDSALTLLAQSLQRFGVVEPIIARRDGEIIGGHQRLAAATSLGLTEVPVIYLDLDDTHTQALNVALNNPAMQGQWDDTRLAQLLQSLAAQEALYWTGFQDADLAALVADITLATTLGGPETGANWRDKTDHSRQGDDVAIDHYGYDGGTVWPRTGDNETKAAPYYLSLPLNLAHQGDNTPGRESLLQRYSRSPFREMEGIIRTYMRATFAEPTIYAVA